MPPHSKAPSAHHPNQVSEESPPGVVQRIGSSSIPAPKVTAAYFIPAVEEESISLAPFPALLISDLIKFLAEGNAWGRPSWHFSRCC
jgi:hypothetical protein